MAKGNGTAEDQKSNVPAALIAEALTELMNYDTQMASIAGRKGAAISRYEAQGVDRELLAGLNKLARKDPDEALAYIHGLTQYATAAEVIPPPADDTWTMSVKQADLDFTAASGEVAERLRMARAQKQGFSAGKRGFNTASNPYQSNPGSPEFVGWLEGHAEGWKLKKTKPTAENVETGTATPGPRRGRKPMTPAEKAAAKALREAVQAEAGTIQ